MRVKHWRLLAVACGLSAVTSAHAACPFNVSGDAATDSLRDGVLLVRYGQGLRGATLVAGTGVAVGMLESFMSNPSNVAQLDINGNGVFDADDAAIIARNVFGFNSRSWLPDGKAGAYATRTTIPTLKAFIDGGCTAPTFTAPTTDQFAASRFLIQSTFGPSRADIAAFLTLPGADTAARASNWMNNQFALTRPKTHFQYILDRKAEYDLNAQDFGNEITREAFWAQALKNQDQLRQRLAFALSEILVVSSNGGSGNVFDLAAHLDLLADNSFGNYRELLYKIALSPAMGSYLSHLRNDGGNSNPNENFAREILQLFGVGLFKLSPDGEKILSGGNPIPTYDESTVKGFAKVFTGLSYDDKYVGVDGYGDTHPSWNWTPDREDLGANFPPEAAGWARSMVPFPGRHNSQTKQLLSYNYTNPVVMGTPVSACSNAVAFASAVPVAPLTGPLLPAIDTTGSGVTTRTKVNAAQAYVTINAAIDNIFCHPNVAPFMAKHLIRFFVTSTPSLGYVSRVAAAFNNDGFGVRGDMKAVMRAVLLDNEALAAIPPIDTANPSKLGKLKEPMLRLSAILRAFNTTSMSGRYQLLYNLDGVESGISQAPLQSTTVFNYFHPEFAPPGPVANAAAVAPEFEITTTTAIAATQNYFGNLVSNNDGNTAFTNNLVGYFGCNTNTVSSTNAQTSSRQHCLLGDLSDLYAVHADSAAMFDYLNLVLMAGTLSTTHRDALVLALNTAFAPTATPPVLAGNPPTSAKMSAYNSALNTWQQLRRNRVKAALWLAVRTPEFQIQR